MTAVKFWDEGTSAYLDVPAEVIASATYEDRGSSALNKLLIDLTYEVKTGTYNPFFNRKVKFEIGSTEVFGGTIERRTGQNPIISTECWSFGAQFLNRYVNEVYESVTPEFIVEDVITRYTDLTYASSVVTGITIERIVFRDKTVAEVLAIFAQALGYYFDTDENGNAYFEPVGSVASGVTINVTDDAVYPPAWEYNALDIITKVIVEGDKQNFFTEETSTATGGQTIINLTYEPVSTVKLIVNNVELQPLVRGSTTGDYELDPENKRITLQTGMTAGHSIVLQYTRSIPIKITQLADVFDEDGNRIIRERKLENKSLKTYADARKFGRGFLEKYSVPQKRAKIPLKAFNSALKSNRTVEVIDTLEGISERFLIIGVSYQYETGITTLEVGALPDLLYDWQKEVMQRLRQLSQEGSSSDLLQEYRFIGHKVAIDLSQTVTTKVSSPTNSFVIGHNTLGRLRSDINFEADCSGNGNSGVWTGSNIGGAQYDATATFDGTSDFNYYLQRLSGGVFDANKYIDAPAVSIPSSRSVVFFIEPTTLNRNIVALGGTARISTNSAGDIITSGLTSVTIKRNGARVYVEFASRTTSAVRFGYYTTYYRGKADEFMVFNSVLTDADLADIDANRFDENHAKYANCKLWWSFDNPLIGNRRTAKEVVEIL